MRIGVLHDQAGEIIALSKIGDLQTAGSKFTKVGMRPGDGQHFLEIELTHEHEKKSLRELHSGYRVDAVTAKLVGKT
jgi:hypothetical protein